MPPSENTCEIQKTRNGKKNHIVSRPISVSDNRDDNKLISMVRVVPRTVRLLEATGTSRTETLMPDRTKHSKFRISRLIRDHQVDQCNSQTTKAGEN